MKEETISRRDFLNWVWGAAGVVVMAEAGLMGLKFSMPRVAEGTFGGVMTAGLVDDFPPGSVTAFNEGRFYLARLADGGFLALYRKCTHLGCVVNWDQSRGQLFCPCHASAFEPNGEVLNPPAPRPLDRFLVTITDGVILVDTGDPLERDHADPDDVVYVQE